MEAVALLPCWLNSRRETPQLELLLTPSSSTFHDFSMPVERCRTAVKNIFCTQSSPGKLLDLKARTGPHGGPHTGLCCASHISYLLGMCMLATILGVEQFLVNPRVQALGCSLFRAAGT